jgi:GT2 family glycosyltransferase
VNPPASCSIVCGHRRRHTVAQAAQVDQLERLLASLMRARPDLLVYLVDTSSTDALRALAGRFGARYLHRPGHPGHACAHNLALREAIAAGSIYHFALDPGIRMPPEGIVKLLGYMEQHPDVGLLAPRVHDPDGGLQPLCKLLPHPLELLVRRLFPLLHRSSGRLARYELHGSGYTRVMEVPALSGCCLLMRLETVQRVGLFDERFLMHFENADLSRRVGRVARTVFVPHVTVVREEGKVAQRDWRRLWRHLVSGARYFNKWGWLRDAERARINARALRAVDQQFCSGRRAYQPKPRISR